MRSTRVSFLNFLYWNILVFFSLLLTIIFIFLCSLQYWHFFSFFLISGENKQHVVWGRYLHRHSLFISSFKLWTKECEGKIWFFSFLIGRWREKNCCLWFMIIIEQKNIVVKTLTSFAVWIGRFKKVLIEMNF